MLDVYRRNAAGSLYPVKTIAPGTWINVVAPDRDERARLLQEAHVPEDFLLYGLDPDEGARFEFDEDNHSGLIIYDMPTVVAHEHQRYSYKTIPLAMIITPDCIVTLHEEPVPLLGMFVEGKVAGFDPERRMLAALQMMYQVSVSYLAYLRDMNKERERTEAKLQKSLRNDDLYGLMSIQRSLVYFMMSLRTDRNVLDNLRRSHQLTLAEDEQDLLEDIGIEVQQATEMSQISNSIIKETADTYSSIISNNMNGVMKFLTSYSIILTIPTLVFSFYGMNVALPFSHSALSWAITILISVLIAAVISVDFWRHRYF
ncbi:magnesium transporter CorA family protein [Lacticaseibacillus thailandensis]|nr:magnesium transporter CorA family protein [Lacticaseibacillus thailandensis]